MLKQKNIHAVILSLLMLSFLFLTGCGSAYKASGQYKRDLLLDRIEKVRVSHEKAKTQFQQVLEQYSSIIEANSGQIRGEYNKLSKEYVKALAINDEISKKVKDVESVGKPLFKGWEKELDEYQNERMRRASEEQLDTTRSRYLKLVHSIKSSKNKVNDVLKSMNDQVLFLSHNLNKKALSVIKRDVEGVKVEVNELIGQIDEAIKESGEFINDSVSIALAESEK